MNDEIKKIVELKTQLGVYDELLRKRGPVGKNYLRVKRHEITKKLRDIPVSGEEYLNALEVIKSYREETRKKSKEIEKTVKRAIIYRENKKGGLLSDHLPTKCCNALRCISNDEYKFEHIVGKITKVEQLEGLSVKQLRRCPGLGKKSMHEIIELCDKFDIKLDYT